jgi:hypothetical protein
MGLNTMKNRKKRKQNNTQVLKALGIKFTAHNGGYHLKIDHNGVKVDFWPSREKWWEAKTRKQGQGLASLLQYVGFIQSNIPGRKGTPFCIKIRKGDSHHSKEISPGVVIDFDEKEIAVMVEVF